jgi:hypothetical protein
MRNTTLIAALAGAAGTGYVLVVRGSLTIDLDIGRSVRPLGPIERLIAAPRETVFDVIAAPYLGRTPRAMQEQLHVLERGSDMALGAHFTGHGLLRTRTIETVRFERPERIAFRLLCGPVPYVVETYELHAVADGTRFVYRGEIGADLWRLGRWWADRVAAPWNRAVSHSIDLIAAEAERRAG